MLNKKCKNAKMRALHPPGFLHSSLAKLMISGRPSGTVEDTKLTHLSAPEVAAEHQIPNTPTVCAPSSPLLLILQTNLAKRGAESTDHPRLNLTQGMQGRKLLGTGVWYPGEMHL